MNAEPGLPLERRIGKRSAGVIEKHLGITKPKSRGLKKPEGMKFDWSLGRYVRDEA